MTNGLNVIAKGRQAWLSLLQKGNVDSYALLVSLSFSLSCLSRTIPTWYNSSRMSLIRITPASTLSRSSPSTVLLLTPHRCYATTSVAPKQRLIVLGTGWAGYAFLKSLSHTTLSRFDIQVVSPTTSFSFTPLLAQASCATLDFRSAVEPIHSNRWMEYHHAWCDAVDLKARKIELTSAFNPQFRLSDPLLPGSAVEEKRKRVTYSLDYDYLVMCVGSYNATFGTRGVKENALFLKDVGDARAIRWRILGLFETANAKFNWFSRQNGRLTHEQDEELKRLLSFVVVGGGPTGSEFAAELHDLVSGRFPPCPVSSVAYVVLNH